MDQDKKRENLCSWNFQSLFPQRGHMLMLKRHEEEGTHVDVEETWRRGDTCWCRRDMKKWILHNRWPLNYWCYEIMVFRSIHSLTWSLFSQVVQDLLVHVSSCYNVMSACVRALPLDPRSGVTPNPLKPCWNSASLLDPVGYFIHGAFRKWDLVK